MVSRDRALGRMRLSFQVPHGKSPQGMYGLQFQSPFYGVDLSAYTLIQGYLHRSAGLVSCRCFIAQEM